MAWKSRLNKHQNKEAKKQTFLYLFLSVVFLLAMFKWGVPALISLATIGSDKKAEAQETNIPVQTPVLNELPEATPSSVIKVQGAALTKQRIRLFLNDNQVDEKVTDTDGNFVFDYVTLKTGENKIGVQAIDESNRESQIDEATVVLDSKKPGIEVTEPKNEATFFGTDQQRIDIKGKVDEKDSELTVNGNFVVVNSEGDFSYRTKLNVGLNEFVVTANDRAGNVAEKLIRVNFSL